MSSHASGPGRMNPDKWFDYLNGKVPDSERAEIERQLATDPHLQRELAMAREIHSRMHDSPEVLVPDEGIVNRGAVLGRRVAIAFAVLVFINVLFGLYAIILMEKKQRPSPPDEQAQAVAGAKAALAISNFGIGEVILRADPGESDAVVQDLIEGAEKYEGLGRRGVPNDTGPLVLIQIPSQQVDAFLERLERIGRIVPESRQGRETKGITFIQIRVVEDAGP